MNQYCKTVTSIVVTLLSITGFSSALAVENTTQQQDTLVVTATRTAQIADEALTPTIVISREDIELSQAKDIAELLRFHAGLELGRYGGPGQPTSLFVRGTESDHVIVMIDGVKINPSTLPIPAIQNINPNLVERIEIVKGPRSALYGSEGIGGVINIITKKYEQSGDVVDASVAAGGENTNQVRGAYHTQTVNVRMGIDVNHFSTDGFPTVDTSTINRGHKNNNVDAYVTSKIGTTEIKLSHWGAQGTTEYQDFTGPVDQDFKNQVTALSLDSMIGTYASVKIKASNMVDDITQNQSQDRTKTRRQALDLQSDIDANENNLVTAGAYYADEDIISDVFGTVVPNDKSSNKIKAIFLQDDFKFSANHIVTAVRYTDNKNFGHKATYNVDYGYTLTPDVKLLAGIGTGFRAPTAVDRYGYGGNPDLKPETSKNIELGSRINVNESQSLSISVFRNEIDNLITLVPVDPVNYVYRAENVQRTRIQGIELGWHWRYKNWQSRVEAIFQDPRDRTTDEVLSRRAKRSMTAGLRYHNQQDVFGVDFVTSSERKDGDVTLPGYGIVNLNYQHALNDAWKINSHIENLLDKDYQLISGYNSQLRFLMIEVSYHH
ncbi:MAG: TonB-dependent receptor [Gammaproteobacteria bacterium]|jgi:vitamin B12 transporter